MQTMLSNALVHFSLLKRIVTRAHKIRTHRKQERKKDLLDHRDDSTFSFDPTTLTVKKLNKYHKKKIDSRKGVLLASYSRKKTRKRKKGGKDNGNSNGNTQSQQQFQHPTPDKENQQQPQQQQQQHQLQPQKQVTDPHSSRVATKKKEFCFLSNVILTHEFVIIIIYGYHACRARNILKFELNFVRFDFVGRIFSLPNFYSHPFPSAQQIELL